jgi:hypothetical protein
VFDQVATFCGSDVAGQAIWREPSESTQGNHGFISYERLAGPQALPLTKGDPTKAYPKTGVSLLKWNITGTHLLVLFGKPWLSHDSMAWH